MKSRLVLYCVESCSMRWHSIKGKNKGKLLTKKRPCTMRGRSCYGCFNRRSSSSILRCCSSVRIAESTALHANMMVFARLTSILPLATMFATRESVRRISVGVRVLSRISISKHLQKFCGKRRESVRAVHCVSGLHEAVRRLYPVLVSGIQMGARPAT